MTPEYHVALLGGGPAAMGVLASAARLFALEGMLERGIAVIESGDALGRGTIGDHAIDSDTAAHVLLECLEGELSALRNSVAAADVASFGSGAIPLPRAAPLLESIGAHFERVLSASSRSDVHTRTRVLRIVREAHGYIVECLDRDGKTLRIRARMLVFAMGGEQLRDVALDAPIHGDISLRAEGANDRVMLTGQLFRPEGLEEARARCARSDGGNVLVLGGSHSAFTAARLLGARHARGRATRVLIASRRRPKLSYGSVAEAHAAGYHAFDANDVCPKTGRVNRLSGLRFHARELAAQVLAAGAARDVQWQLLSSMTPRALRAAIASATLVVPAFGYSARSVPLFDGDARIALRAEHGGALVDDACAVVASDGQALKGIYGLGLASGFVPSGELGGEPSFRGQTNGLWLYQHRVGERIVSAIMRDNGGTR